MVKETVLSDGLFDHVKTAFFVNQFDTNKNKNRTIKLPMKKIFLILGICAFVFTSCEKEKTMKFTEIADMLYEVTYDTYSEEPIGTYQEFAGEMACSCVRNGDYVGRNFDYYMNRSATFVVHTTAKKGRYATIGVARLTKVNNTMIDAGLTDRQIKILPWALLDGMNEKGVVVTSNIVTKVDEGTIPHTGTNPGAPELNILFVIRALIDNCASVQEAIDYLESHNITPFESSNMNLHIMISDPKETYVVEIINNQIVARPHNIMTNFYLFLDEIPDHALGVERYNILKEHYAEGGVSMEGMWNLMKRVKYTNAYLAENKWYSEIAPLFGIPYSEIASYQSILDDYLISEEEEWMVEKAYIDQNGLREETEWWDSVHNSIYNIRDKKLWVTLHEQNTIHRFSL